MMAVIRTIYLQSATFGGATWSATEDGTLELQVSHRGNAIQDRTGVDEYATSVVIVDKECVAVLKLRECVRTEALGGTAGALVCVLKTPTGTSNITIATVKISDINMRQGRAEFGDCDITFVHESANGTTVPVTAPA